MREFFLFPNNTYVFIRLTFVTSSIIINMLLLNASGASVVVDCEPTSDEELKSLLGSSYNARYMSLSRPIMQSSNPNDFSPKLLDDRLSIDYKNSKGVVMPSTLNTDVETNIKRQATEVTDQENRRLRRSDKFWESTVTNLNSPTKTKNEKFGSKEQLLFKRFKRQVLHPLKAKSGNKRNPKNSPPHLPWNCKQETRWVDLGADHFPRYLRSVKCSSERCFYGHYFCRPKTSPIRVLRRLAEKCQLFHPKTASNKTHFPQKPIFKEPWAFEQVDVSFFCECALF